MKKNTEEQRKARMVAADFIAIGALREKYGTEGLFKMLSLQTDEIELVDNGEPLQAPRKPSRDYSIAFHDEALLVADGMEKQGGSFIKGLASALRHADRINMEKILLTWPDEWEMYRDVARRLQRVGQ